MLSLLHRFVPAHHSKNKRIKIISVCYLLMITDWNIHTQFHKLEKQDLKIMAKKSLYYMAPKVNLKKKKSGGWGSILHDAWKQWLWTNICKPKVSFNHELHMTAKNSVWFQGCPGQLCSVYITTWGAERNSRGQCPRDLPFHLQGLDSPLPHYRDDSILARLIWRAIQSRPWFLPGVWGRRLQNSWNKKKRFTEVHIFHSHCQHACPSWMVLGEVDPVFKFCHSLQ